MPVSCLWLLGAMNDQLDHRRTRRTQIRARVGDAAIREPSGRDRRTGAAGFGSNTLVSLNQAAGVGFKPTIRVDPGCRSSDRALPAVKAVATARYLIAVGLASEQGMVARYRPEGSAADPAGRHLPAVHGRSGADRTFRRLLARRSCGRLPGRIGTGVGWLSVSRRPGA